MPKTNDLADLLFEHYVKPYAEDKMMQRIRASMQHEMTCGDLSHMHGAVKIKWEAPVNVPSDDGDPQAS